MDKRRVPSCGIDSCRVHYFAGSLRERMVYRAFVLSFGDWSIEELYVFACLYAQLEKAHER